MNPVDRSNGASSAPGPYLRWVDLVATACVDALSAKTLCVDLVELGARIIERLEVEPPGSVLSEGLLQALEDLYSINVVRFPNGSSVEATQLTRQIQRTGLALTDLWPQLIEPYLDTRPVDVPARVAGRVRTRRWWRCAPGDGRFR